MSRFKTGAKGGPLQPGGMPVDPYEPACDGACHDPAYTLRPPQNCRWCDEKLWRLDGWLLICPRCDQVPGRTWPRLRGSNIDVGWDQKYGG